jgi:hypothetical protein
VVSFREYENVYGDSGGLNMPKRYTDNKLAKDQYKAKKEERKKALAQRRKG